MKHARPPIQADQPRLLASRNFLLLWGVGGIGNATRWLEVLAAALFTLDVTGSEFDVAVVSAARSLPLLFTGALSGVIADAFNRRAIVLGGAILSLASAATIAVLAWLGVVQPWHLFTASLVSGLVYGTEMSTRRRMAGESVAPSLVARAVALDSMTGSASRVAGPLIGGVAYQFLGLFGAFCVSTVLSVAAVAMAGQLRHQQARRPLSPRAVLTDLAEAAVVVRRSAVLLGLLGVTVAQNLFGFSYSALMAPVGQDVFGASAALVGVMSAAEPAGATLGGILLAWRGTPRGQPVWLLLGGAAAFMAAMGLLPAVPWFWAACGLLLAGGFGVALYSNEQTTIALAYAPAPVRSRVMGLMTVAVGTWPLGMLLAGWLADHVGPLWALGALGWGGLLWLAAVGSVLARRR